VVTVERGLDPRDFALVAFGGAGPMHACAVAEELGMDTVLVPRASGVLSALGLAISDLRRDLVQPLLGPLAEADPEPAFAALERQAREELEDPGCARRADLRYRGQSFELTVDADDPAGLAERFHAAHEQRYGYAMRDEAVELVAARVVATVAVPRPELRDDAPRGGDPVRGRRTAWFDEGGVVEVDVLDRGRMGPGSRVRGPAVLELAEATCVVRPAWSGAVDAAGTLVLERERERA
jgi:N-methylhydantoinase A